MTTDKLTYSLVVSIKYIIIALKLKKTKRDSMV